MIRRPQQPELVVGWHPDRFTLWHGTLTAAFVHVSWVGQPTRHDAIMATLRESAHNLRNEIRLRRGPAAAFSFQPWGDRCP